MAVRRICLAEEKKGNKQIVLKWEKKGKIILGGKKTETNKYDMNYCFP